MLAPVSSLQVETEWYFGYLAGNFNRFHKIESKEFYGMDETSHGQMLKLGFLKALS